MLRRTRTRTSLTSIPTAPTTLSTEQLAAVAGGLTRKGCGGGGGTSWSSTYPTDPDGLITIDDE